MATEAGTASDRRYHRLDRNQPNESAAGQDDRQLTQLDAGVEGQQRQQAFLIG